MTSLKKVQAKIGSNMVPARHSGKEKKIPSNRKIQLKFSKLLTNAFKKSQQFWSGKVQKGEDKIFGDMVALELKGLSCSILKVKFKDEVNNQIIFKNQVFNLQ